MPSPRHAKRLLPKRKDETMLKFNHNDLFGKEDAADA
nr:MAG TPA: hypothetical protein [Caudoviricetes sp.]